MTGIVLELTELADHLACQRSEILRKWQDMVESDPKLTGGESLPRAEFLDHIPQLLAAFERRLRQVAVDSASSHVAGQQSAAAHGLQRWRQGYDLREVARELGRLNECIVLELNLYACGHADFSLEALSHAQQLWAALCSTAIEESVSQYFALQQQEAAGHVKDLEIALEQIRELEQQRGEVWEQAAHDLRGNLHVVANVSVGLARRDRSDRSRENFARILSRNLSSIHQLLNDVTSLARLQAGREKRQIGSLDVSNILLLLCDGIRPLAEQRGLYLRLSGPREWIVDGDGVKVRRIAQNLILNAVKYTNHGGVTVTWGDSDNDDSKRWVLGVTDTGPGFHTESGKPIAAVLDGKPTLPAQRAAEPREGEASNDSAPPPIGHVETPALNDEPGEGIGLSIVKRLSEMLDASVEMQSIPNEGTRFKILFPRHYS